MKRLIIALLGVVVLSGCATARAPVTGFWYTETQSSITATANAAGNRVGQACAQSILGLVATGDASVETARRNGGITTITSIDESSNSILGIIAKYCTIVRGK